METLISLRQKIKFHMKPITLKKKTSRSIYEYSICKDWSLRQPVVSLWNQLSSI